jgi:hypothetical protein
MERKNMMIIKLFAASGAETLPIRDKVNLALNKLNELYKKTGFAFQMLRWENESAAVPATGRSQDEYTKLIEDSDMVAVVIENTLGKYTAEEFKYAVELFQKNKKSPRVVVYTLPSNADNKSRHSFIKKLRSGRSDYFHDKVANPDQLIYEITCELIRIITDYEAEQKAAAQSAADTIARLDLTGDLIKEAAALFQEGKYREAAAALNIEKICEKAEKPSVAQKEIAEAFVFKAKLELTNVQNKGRFITADNLFNKAVRASRNPEILFEYAYYCQDQNNFKKSEELYIETLSLYRGLAADNPAKYNPDVAATLNNLAILHKKNGNYTQAETEYNEALTIHRRLAASSPAKYYPDVATALNNLANLHQKNGDHTQAETEYNEALTLYRGFAADNPAKYNPSVAMTLNNLASLHQENGDYMQAEPEYTEALAIRRRLAADYPAKYNPGVAMILNNLAILHSDTGNYTQAETEYTEALTLYRGLAADCPAVYNPDVAMTLNNLAGLHGNTRDYTQAKAECDEALELITPFYNKNPQAFQSRYDTIKRTARKLKKLLRS